MMLWSGKQYEFFIVALTNRGKLISAYVRASSIANAMDKFIDQLDLAGMIVEYKFCVRKEIVYPDAKATEL